MTLLRLATTLAITGIAATLWLNRRGGGTTWTAPLAGGLPSDAGASFPVIPAMPAVPAEPAAPVMFAAANDASSDDASAPFPGLAATSALDLQSPVSAIPGEPGSPAASSEATTPDSPNAAERLQAAGLAEAPGNDPFRSTSEDGPDARSPGLADFTRAA